jgi:hypothetical protein
LSVPDDKFAAHEQRSALGRKHIDGRVDAASIEASAISVENITREEGLSRDVARRLADLLGLAADEVDRRTEGTESG